METSNTLKKLSLLFGFLVVAYTLFYLYFFLNGSLFYFGEAISYEGLMRVLLGKSFASQPQEIPLSLTPYTPLFLSPMILLGKLIKWNRIEEIMILARTFQSGLLFILFLFLNHIRKTFFSDKSTVFSFLFVAGLVFFYNPTMELALRPDTLSFLCEAGSVFYLLRYLKYSKLKSIALAALASGMAVAIKLNTLGAVGGIILFLLVNKEMRALGIYLVGFVFSASLLLAILYFRLGPIFSDNILISIQSFVLSPADAIKVYSKFFDLFIFPLIFYFFLILWGMGTLPQRKERLLFLYVLTFSFIVAALGQMKWGAFHNYFLGFLYLGTIPASIAVQQLSESKNQNQHFFFLLFCMLHLVFYILRGSSIPVKIWQDRDHFRELTQIRSLLQEKLPKGFIYTSDEQLHLAFVDRVAIGVLSEELLQTTPKLMQGIEKIRFKLQEIKPSGYLLPCDKFETGSVYGLFFDAKELTPLQKVKTGKYCLYF